MHSKNYKKIDIIKKLSLKTGFSVNFSKKVIDDLIKILIQNLKKDRLNLKNMGSFRLIHKKERIGRNPKTKETFIISERKSVNFYPSKKILNKLNNLI